MGQTEVLALCLEQQLPIDVLTQPISLLGNRGGGKTYGGMKLFELAYDLDVQCGVIDVVGKWWGLRLGKDGQPKGGLKNVYIFGGKHADLPLQADKGAFTAKLVVDKRIHFILDLSLMRKGDRQRFLAEFLEELYLLKKQQDNPTAMVLFIEEAHAVAPQVIRKDSPWVGRMLGAIEDIVREGRNAGIGVVIMDQRPATVNKNVLWLTEVVIALRIISNDDRQVIKDWIVKKAESAEVQISDNLPFFKNGKGYLYAPVYELFGEIQILSKRTYDSTASVKIGQHRAPIGQLTPVDIEAVQGAMAEVLQEAEKNDPKSLRRRIAELEGQLSKKLPPPPPAAPVKVHVLDEKLVARLERTLRDLQELAQRNGAWADAFAEVAQDLTGKLAEATRAPPTVTNSVHRPKMLFPARVIERAQRVVAAAHVDGLDVTQKTMHMLRIIAQCGSVSRPDLALMSGYGSADNRAFRNQLYALTGAALASSAGGAVEATSEGLARLPKDLGQPPTASELTSLWGHKLETKARVMLGIILDRGSITRAELAELTGYNSPDNRAFRNQLYVLTGNHLVEGKGEVRPVRLLVEGARAAA